MTGYQKEIVIKNFAIMRPGGEISKFFEDQIIHISHDKVEEFESRGWIAPVSDDAWLVDGSETNQ